MAPLGFLLLYAIPLISTPRGTITVRENRNYDCYLRTFTWIETGVTDVVSPQPLLVYAVWRPRVGRGAKRPCQSPFWSDMLTLPSEVLPNPNSDLVVYAHQR